MKTVLPFLIIILLVTPVFGSSDWVEYGRNSDGDVYLYNKDRIKQIKKNIVHVWIKDIFPKERDGVESLVLLYEIDCRREMFRVLSMIGYDNKDTKNDNTLFDIPLDNNKNPIWFNIPPDSGMEPILKKVCKLPNIKK